jgi:glyoxylase-like metal-dependent hydrolase (beta-lactamase superfamily II)
MNQEWPTFARTISSTDFMALKILQLPLGPLPTNCYVAACTTTNQAAVIDPSWAGRSILERVSKEGWTVSHILITHPHYDHVGGLAELKELTGATVYVHPEAEQMLERAPAAARIWGFTVDPPPKADSLLNEGDMVEVGELKLEVLFTPGHAPGHVCFYLAEHDVVFDGDVLFRGSIGRTDLPGGDYDLLMSSIREKLLPLPDATVVLSGHGIATTIGEERQNNPFLVG